MSFRTNPAPYQRSNRSTLKIMLTLCAALLVLWVFAIVYSFNLTSKVNEYLVTLVNEGETPATVNYGLRAILMVVISLVVTALCDVATSLIRHKKGANIGKEILDNLVHNYSYVTAIIYALTLPVYVNYYVVIIGAIFATVIVKNVFGGFGRNIFNPAIMARIFVGLCFVNAFNVPSELINAASGIDATTGATLTTAFNSTGGWLATSYSSGLETIKGSIFSSYGIKDILLGNYVGALGETFTIVIFALGIILSILKVINWRTPLFYLGTVALTSLVIALVLGFDQPLTYVIYHLSLGGVMFGAVFMLTDPVTAPTSPFGKSLIGVFAGLMTVLIRIKGGYPEGVMFSIALCNFISPAIDYFSTGKTNSHLKRKYSIVFGLLAVAIALNTGIAYAVNDGKEVYEKGGMDIAAYNELVSNMNLKDGQELQINDKYTIKDNEHIIGYYEVVNSKTKEIEGYCYEVQYKGVVEVEYPLSYTSDSYVIISTDGTLQSYSAIVPPCSKGKTYFKSIEDVEGYVSDTLINKDLTYIDGKSYDALAGASDFTTPALVEIFNYAYAEFNARG